jgi:hypothetical protein
MIRQENRNLCDLCSSRRVGFKDCGLCGNNGGLPRDGPKIIYGPQKVRMLTKEINIRFRYPF